MKRIVHGRCAPKVEPRPVTRAVTEIGDLRGRQMIYDTVYADGPTAFRPPPTRVSESDSVRIATRFD